MLTHDKLDFPPPTCSDTFSDHLRKSRKYIIKRKRRKLFDKEGKIISRVIYAAVTEPLPNRFNGGGEKLRIPEYRRGKRFSRTCLLPAKLIARAQFY